MVGDEIELFKMVVCMFDVLKMECDEIDEGEFKDIMKGVDEVLEVIN